MTTPTPREILGIHHVTAIASDPQTNVDFYAGVLGLRLVKRTVNFDDPSTYHLYYGDETGRPGSILTFFPWPGARRGSRGGGQATVTSFSVPEGSLGYWHERLSSRGVVHDDPSERFDEEVLTLLDPDGLKLELVTHAGAADLEPWAGGPVPERHALRGFHSVTLAENDPAVTTGLLADGMGFRPAGELGPRSRFEVGAGGLGTRVDVVATGEGRGRIAAGTVHHVAFRVADDAAQLAWQRRLSDLGQQVTEVRDRQYFRSIYFREPGGVLFELATDPPGFTRDETVAELGTGLKLPPWLEPHRERIAGVLPPLDVASSSPAETAAVEVAS